MRLPGHQSPAFFTTPVVIPGPSAGGERRREQGAVGRLRAGERHQSAGESRRRSVVTLTATARSPRGLGW
ncbi:hypothetical protein ACFWBR_41220 [Streptomyces sp. NPDC060006]|uniref:hypothetical protein n=1 Tax=Streptomyces sp. NPDC060006 TaxID=3347035 RepID=UPI0036847E8C